MCVTNTTGRRPQPVVVDSHQVSLAQSLLTQRLFSAYVSVNTPKLSHCSFDVQTPVESVSTVTDTKARLKRRRKPQKPGKTAKNNERHFVVHDYHDHLHDPDGDVDDAEDENQRRRGGVNVAFPIKLHSVLEQVEADGFSHIVSWQKHGRAFVIHKPKDFVDYVMPKYFRQSKLTSFQRQLNLYGFCRLTRGPDAGGYYHELFLRGKVCLSKKMMRTKVKGTKFKAASSPEQEPDFYKMEPIVSSDLFVEEMKKQNCSGADQSNPCDYSFVSNVRNVDPFQSQYVQPFPINVQPFQTDMEPCQSDMQPYQGDILPYQPEIPLFQADMQPFQSGMQSFQSDMQPFQAASFSSISNLNVNPRVPSMDPMSSVSYSIPADADRILDEAVDELFMLHEVSDNLDDFAHDWDPCFDQSSVSGPVVEDDSQLGYLLERLLDD